MLDSASKILERIMYTRIEAIAEKHLSDRQYGFRKGTSTVDAINLVVNIAKDAISVTRFGTPKYLQKLIASYFTDRILQYDTDDGLKVYIVTEGVPQRLGTGAAFMDYPVQRPT